MCFIVIGKIPLNLNASFIEGLFQLINTPPKFGSSHRDVQMNKSRIFIELCTLSLQKIFNEKSRKAKYQKHNEENFIPILLLK